MFEVRPADTAEEQARKDAARTRLDLATKALRRAHAENDRLMEMAEDAGRFTGDGLLAQRKAASLLSREAVALRAALEEFRQSCLPEGEPGSERIDPRPAFEPGILAQLADAVIAIDSRQQVLYLNAAAEQRYGVRARDAAGKPLGDLYTRRWAQPEDEAAASASLAERGFWRGEMVHVTRSGREIEVESTFSVLRDERGQETGWALILRDISDRKRAEEALAAAHRQIQAIIDNTPAAVYVFDLEGRFVLLSRAVARLFDCTPQEMIGRKRGEFLPKEDAERDEANDRRVLEEGRALDFEESSQVKGRTITWLTTKFPLRDAQGKIWAIGGISIDMSERKRMEDALRQSEARERARAHELQTLLDAVPAAVWIAHDPQATQVTGNRLSYDWLGLPQGVNPSQLLPEGERAKTFRILKDGVEVAPLEMPLRMAAEGACIRDHEFDFVYPDGSVRHMLGNASPLMDEHGELRGAVSAFIDITVRKRAQKSLFQAHQRLNALMNALPVGVSFSDDPTCERITGNPAALAQFGVGPGDNLSASASDSGAFGRQLRFFAGGREITDAELPLQRAVREGRVIPPVEMEVHLPSGRCWILEGSAAPIRGQDGSIEGGVAVTVDITERKNTEERLRRSQKLESIGLLAGGIAHDFNNLLVGVVGGASFAQDMLPPGHPAGELMGRVVKAGEEAAHLTRQLLAYAGKGRFVLQPVNLSTLIPEISGLVEPALSSKIELRFVLDPELPNIEGDRGQIQQVFMNLVLNAAEAIGGEFGTITVTTGTQVVDESSRCRLEAMEELAAGAYVLLEVRDTGCGMDAATRAQIFEPFFSTKFTGRGLGLAALAGIVRGHRGAIEVRSEPGRGASFRVLFPALVGAVAPARTKKKRSIAGKGTVLVVDDEEYVRNVARLSLEHYGYTVLVAESGPAALDAAKRHPGEIGLVLLDQSMPSMNGEELLPELRKIRPGLKAAVSSGFSEGDTMKLFRGQKVTAFIAKPYTPKTLAEQVGRCLRARGK